MRIKLAPILDDASRLSEAIESRSWYHACHAAHACLCAMPSPAWAEPTPGLAQYGIGEYECNQELNLLRAQVMAWLAALIRADRTWEVDDDWPEPKNLRASMQRLLAYLPEEATCSHG